MVKKQVCVIGMGRFGSTMARELYQSGHDVLAIDSDEARVQAQSGQVTYAVRADATNEATLRELDLPHYDVAVVALGSDHVQASVGVTVLLKGMAVPMIIARAANDLHGETLQRIGADRVIFPEAENARRVARVEFTRELIDYMPILSDYGISKIRPSEGMLNRTLEDAGLAGGDRHGISVIAIRRGRTSFLHPAKDEVIQGGDVLILAAGSAELTNLAHQNAKRLEADFAEARRRPRVSRRF